VANGPREPGVGAELIGSDIYKNYENEFSVIDNCKLSPIKYNKNEKLHDIEVSRIYQSTSRLVKYINIIVYYYLLSIVSQNLFCNHIR